MRDTALRHLRELAGIHWHVLRWCSLLGGGRCWQMSGLPLYPAPAMLLHCGRWGSMNASCCNCSPYCPMLLPQPCLHSFPEVTRKEPLQALSLHFWAPPAHSQPSGPNTLSEQPLWKPFPSKGIDRRSSLSSSDPLTPNKYPQSSICIGAYIRELAHPSFAVSKASSIWSRSSP